MRSSASSTTTRSQFYPQANYNLNASRNRASARRHVAAAAGRRSVLLAVPGRAGRGVADRSVRPRAPPDRSRAGARLRHRAGSPRRRAVGGDQRRGELHHVARARPPARDLAAHRAELRRTRSASSICGTRAASCRKLEVEQVQSQYQQALAAIPALEQQIAAQENLIAVLQGRNPYPIPRGKTHRPAGRAGHSRRPAVVAAGAAPGHPAGRAGPDRRERRHRRRERAVLSRSSRSPARFGSVSAAFGNFLTRTGDRVVALPPDSPARSSPRARSPARCARAEADEREALAVTSRRSSTRSARPTTRWSARSRSARNRRRRSSASRRCASTRACRASGSTTATRAISKCCMPKTSCSAAELASVRSYADALYADRRRLQGDGRRLGRSGRPNRATAAAGQTRRRRADRGPLIRRVPRQRF